ncbi:Uncharacterised protein [Bordetella pertussis]|nr:Uncharacterised protein [Bordetella pertussis]
MAMTPSMIRMRTRSMMREAPATRPMRVPIAIVMRTTSAPMARDMRLPCTTREYTSRPSASVPSRKASPGGVRRMRGCIIAGSVLAIQEAATLMATISSSTPPPSSASLLWRRMDVMPRLRIVSSGSVDR